LQADVDSEQEDDRITVQRMDTSASSTAYRRGSFVQELGLELAVLPDIVSFDQVVTEPSLLPSLLARLTIAARTVRVNSGLCTPRLAAARRSGRLRHLQRFSVSRSLPRLVWLDF